MRLISGTHRLPQCPGHDARANAPRERSPSWHTTRRIRISTRNTVERDRATPNPASAAAPARPAKGDRYPPDRRGQPLRAPGIPRRELGDLLTEGALRTLRVLADQAPHVQLDHHASPSHGKICQPPRVPGVHSS